MLFIITLCTPQTFKALTRVQDLFSIFAINLRTHSDNSTDVLIIRDKQKDAIDTKTSKIMKSQINENACNMKQLGEAMYLKLCNHLDTFTARWTDSISSKTHQILGLPVAISNVEISLTERHVLTLTDNDRETVCPCGDHWFPLLCNNRGRKWRTNNFTTKLIIDQHMTGWYHLTNMSTAWNIW